MKLYMDYILCVVQTQRISRHKVFWFWRIKNKKIRNQALLYKSKWMIFYKFMSISELSIVFSTTSAYACHCQVINLVPSRLTWRWQHHTNQTVSILPNHNHPKQPHIPASLLQTLIWSYKYPISRNCRKVD